MSEESKKVKIMTGIVTSASRDKSLTVVVHWARPHPKYKKVVRKETKYQVHDEQNLASVGDTVLFKQTKPFSKTKCHELVEVKSKAA